MAAKGTLAHVAIIMDGNGRWAQRRGLNRTKGHQAGVEASMRIIKAAIHSGIPYLSLYAFSTENWKRSRTEVSFIMRLIAGKLREYYPFYRDNQVRIVHSGNTSTLPPSANKEIIRVVEETKHHKAITVNLAINYGGRDEIVRAVNRCLANQNGNMPHITEENISNNCDLPYLPDVDLLIRSSGEKRISNFMLWKSAYAELYFSDTLWPDWDSKTWQAALESFYLRNRTFGS